MDRLVSNEYRPIHTDFKRCFWEIPSLIYGLAVYILANAISLLDTWHLGINVLEHQQSNT